MTTFSVTYEIFPSYTDNEEFLHDEGTSGYIAQGIPLRQAIDLALETTSSKCSLECIQANTSSMESAEWFTFYNSMNWDDGRTEQRSLHIPANVTGASRKRIAKLINAR